LFLYGSVEEKEKEKPRRSFDVVSVRVKKKLITITYFNTTVKEHIDPDPFFCFYFNNKNKNITTRTWPIHQHLSITQTTIRPSSMLASISHPFTLKANVLLHRAGGKALDFGGGPSLWPSFLLAQYVDSIQFCEYTESNLQAVQAWLDRSSNAHDWTTFFQYLLQANQTSESELST
jgi:hypothetical protein